VSNVQLNEAHQNVNAFSFFSRILLPLFDVDTQMLFLAGKADNTIGFYELNDRDPVLTEGLR
jgi:hypothetical protein